MPAIPTPTALVAARAIPSFRPLNISEDVLTAPPSDGFDPESGHDVVEIVLVIGILVSGLLLFGMLASFMLRTPKTGGPLTFLEWWTYFNAQMVAAYFAGPEDGLNRRPQTGPPTQTHLETLDTASTLEAGTPTELLENSSTVERVGHDASSARVSSRYSTTPPRPLPTHDPAY